MKVEVELFERFDTGEAGLTQPSFDAALIAALPFGLQRLDEEGLRVDEIPVDMRERASGESKLQGKKALVLVLTVAGTLLTAELLRRRRP